MIVTPSFASPIFSRVFQVKTCYFFVLLTRYETHRTKNDKKQKTSIGQELCLESLR
ncbi:unnamed protein product [Ixodes persulcatus]